MAAAAPGEVETREEDGTRRGNDILSRLEVYRYSVLVSQGR
jgi:hypothetical protein